MLFYQTRKTNIYRIFLILVFTTNLFSCTSYTDPEAVALEYVDAVYGGRLAIFKKLVEEKDHLKTKDYEYFVKEQSSGKFKTQLRRDGISEVKVIKKSIGKSRATITIKVLFRNKAQKTLRIPLHYKKERWYVDAMQWGSW